VSSESFVRPTEGGAYVKLRVSPGAKSTEIKGLYGKEALRLAVAAPPVEGKANAEIERYLATLMGVKRSKVAVTKGRSRRNKLVFVSGVKAETVQEGLGLVR
jgi:uncharacterized protein (TIGR00251 family)